MGALIAWYGALADSHPRAVFAILVALCTTAALSLAVGFIVRGGDRLAERDERAEG